MSNNIKYITVKEYAAMHGVAERTVRQAASTGRIPGAQKLSGVWIIPEDAPYPADKRIKSGNYRNWREKHGQIKDNE